MRGRILVCAGLLAIGAVAGCTNEESGQARSAQPAESAQQGANPSAAAPSSGTSAPAGPSRSLTGALLPDSAFPAGSKVQRSTKVPPKPDFSKVKTVPAECGQKNQDTQIGAEDGEFALATASTREGTVIVTALLRPAADVVQKYRDFVSSCGRFTISAGGQQLTSRNKELDVSSIGEPQSIGFTQRTSGPGQIADSAGVTVNTAGVTVNVVVVDQSGSTADPAQAIQLTRQAVARVEQVLGG